MLEIEARLPDLHEMFEEVFAGRNDATVSEWVEGPAKPLGLG